MRAALVLWMLASAAAAQTTFGGRDLRDVELACAAGRWDDCDVVTSLYLQGSPAANVPADANKAAALLEQSCQRNEPRACVKLAMVIEEGKRLPFDGARVQALYDKACTLGWQAACNRKVTPPPDAPQAAQSSGGRHQIVERQPADRGPLEAGCKAGEPDACLALAGMLLDGEGGKPDVKRALALFKTACDQGDMRGCASLGAAYAEGKAVPKDEEKAESFLVRSCQSPEGYGCGALGDLYAARRSEADLSKAQTAYDRACQKGDTLACRKLDELLLRR